MVSPLRARAVVTGLGVIAPNGIDIEAFWKSTLDGVSGIGPITLFDASRHPARIAGEIKGFDPLAFIPSELKPQRMARHTQLAVAAATLALRDANFSPITDHDGSFTIPVILGISYSALDVIDDQIAVMHRKGPEFVSHHVVGSSTPQAAAGAVSRSLGVPCESHTISSACAAGLDAIARGAEMIRSGRADLVIAGGADSPISPFGFASFAAAGIASLRNDDPQRASRPFDVDRDTGVISEGAGILVLENLESALARGARPYLEITGYATGADVSTEDPATGLERTMRGALDNAARRVEDIDYICAHGPGHPLLDRIETRMIKRVFGQKAYGIPVSSIKGVTGNPLAAAGGLQVATSALVIRHGLVPPTANLDKKDPECDLDFVAKRARAADIRCILINAHGVGGTNSSLIVERVEAIP